MLNNPSTTALGLTSILIVSFLIDLLLPLGISPAILYLPILIANIRTPFPAKVMFHFCTLITAFIFIAYMSSASVMADESVIIMNRVLAVIAVWVIGWLCYIIKQGQIRLNEELETNKQKDSALIHQSRMAGIGEMIGYVAHQWRQPLTTLHLIFFNIKDSYEHDELDKESLDTSFEKSKELIETLSSTIDDFRDFFRPTDPSKGREAIDVFRSVQHVLNLISISFQKSHIEINLEIKDTKTHVLNYRNEFIHVVMNVLKNSKDAILDNQISEGRIWIRSALKDDRITVYCVDNGGGIDESNLHKIFEPYFTTKDSYGTGIGLYMSRVIVHSHMGGTISAKNTITPYGKGAQIEISLPIHKETK